MLKNKKVLVAGSAGLLGANLVKELLFQGAEVVATDISLERLDKRLNEIGIVDKHPGLVLQEVDLSHKETVVAMFDGLEGLTGAVNCSYPRNKNYGKHFFDVEPEDFNENLSLNLGSSFLFMQQCAVYFRRTQSPFSLVNISSIYGAMAPKFSVYDNTAMTMPVEYAAIKSGLNHLSKYATKYVGDSRFRVNVVSPGGIIDQQPNSFLEAYRKETFGKGMLEVTDVLGAIVFLLSSLADYVNAQNIIVDDGFST